MFFGLFSDSLVQNTYFLNRFCEKSRTFANGVKKNRQIAPRPRFCSEFRCGSHGSDGFVLWGNMLLLLMVFSRCRFSRTFAPGGRAAWLVKALKSPGVDTRHETRDRIQETQDNFQTIFGQVADNVRTCLENSQIFFR